jgi:peptidoglycan/xylan/chitin deacetylase (PgdA/CDA1 family)
MRPAFALLALVLVAAVLRSSCDTSEAPPYLDTQPTPTLPPSVQARLVEFVPTEDRVVALTFDTGVDAPPDAVESALRALRAAGVRATFSVTGLWGERERDLLFSIAADGHQIINGTYDGASFTGASTGAAALTPDQRRLALSRAEVTVYRYTSRSTRPYARPPFGDIDDSVLHDAAANSYTIAVRWGVDIPATMAAADIAPLVMRAARAGVIFRLPLTTAAAAALPGVIDALQSASYELLTIEELLQTTNH